MTQNDPTPAATTEAAPALPKNTVSKIVIVAGDKFAVPLSTDNEQLRASLVPNFPDVRAAKIVLGETEYEGQIYASVEFVKQAGQKGLGGAALARLLADVPPLTMDAARVLSNTQRELLARLTSGQLTIDEALADGGAAIEDVLQSTQDADGLHAEGDALCAAIDRLPAVADRAPCAW